MSRSDRPERPYLRIGLMALFILVADRITKLWVVEWMELDRFGVIDVWPPYLRFTMAWNRGINFGLFDSDGDMGRWILIGVALAITAVLLVWARSVRGWLVPLSIGLVVGGAIGNVWDRIVYGAVADFLNMSCCGISNPYAFNIADIAIFAGAAGLILFSGKEAKGA
ncbi:signal peptidase II [Oceanomicrobium pacificus]|uniref:Lipoprotein signal peptidase n=1 Tax=Oceanomicrobium pacificus TaxID=2692916 RepID=A0A6B0TS38_9RHOB|nr:signal peptidase II [Oceanomicrobium pacificus]MXU64548.1 signal peptidase II [Oceanomicrobium pacificus]